MCQELEPIKSTGFWSSSSWTRIIGGFATIYIIWKATKKAAHTINEKYLRPYHWLYIYKSSRKHNEIYLLIELYTLLYPSIYFHYFFKWSWSLIRSHHKELKHSYSTNYKVSKWRYLSKIIGLFIASILYWSECDLFIKKQIHRNKDLSLNHWCCKKALQSIDREEIRWRKKVRQILNVHFKIERVGI